MKASTRNLRWTAEETLTLKSCPVTSTHALGCTQPVYLLNKWGEKQNQINKHDTERQDPNSNQKLQQKTKTRRQTQNENQQHQQKGLKSQIRFREHCHGINLWKKSDKAVVTRCAGNHELAINMTMMQLSTQTFLVKCQF